MEIVTEENHISKLGICIFLLAALFYLYEFFYALLLAVWSMKLPALYDLARVGHRRSNTWLYF